MECIKAAKCVKQINKLINIFQYTAKLYNSEINVKIFKL